ncbi:MAG: hypothetical protein ACOVRN_16830 [Flavobacterium sp.]
MDYEITELLYATDFMSTAGSCWGYIYSYYFQIDKNGNVNVTYGQAHYNDPQPQPTKLLFEIVDNVKVPDYIIELYKHLIKTHLVTPHVRGNVACRLEKMEMFFEIVKKLKTSIKYMSDNPQHVGDIHQQTDLFKQKTLLLKVELKKMNTKIENIQNAYFDTLTDNKQLKSENTMLKEKIQQLEAELKTQKTKTVYVEVNNPTIFTQPFTNSINTGTLSNASNRMVLNEITGIYEPEDEY